MNVRALLLPLLFACCLRGGAQAPLSAGQWQSDLRWLQQTVHSRYAFLFSEWPAASFDSSADDLYRRIPSMNVQEIRAGFMALVAGFRIGHTGIGFSVQEGKERKSFFRLYPLTIDRFPDGVFVRNADKRYAAAVGGRLLRIGDVPVDTALARLHRVISCENDQFFASNLHYYIRLPELLQALRIAPSADSVSLLLEKDGRPYRVVLHAEASRELFTRSEIDLPEGWIDAAPGFGTAKAPLWLREPHRLRYFEYDRSSTTLYVRHSGVWEPEGEPIAGFFERVFRFADSVKAERLVRDLRLNGGGNNYLNKSVVTGVIRNRRINRYGHFFVLLGKTTFSAAQNLTNALEKYTEVVFVGEPTAEHVNFWGDNRKELLPNSHLEVFLSYLWWQDSDPRDTRKWTAPLVAAPMTFADYRSGGDPALAAVHAFRDTATFNDRFNALWDAGKRDEAEALLHAFVTNPLHRYSKDDLAGDLNSTGEYLLQQDDKEAAARWYGMLRRQFPGNELIRAHAKETEGFLKQ